MAAAEDLFMEGGQSPILTLLLKISEETRDFPRIKMFNVALHNLKKSGKNTEPIIKWLNTQVFHDPVFIRKLRYYQTVTEIPEAAIEYFGRDYLSHPEFNYEKEFMEKLDRIQLKIDEYVGQLIDMLSTTEKISFDQ